MTDHVSEFPVNTKPALASLTQVLLTVLILSSCGGGSGGNSSLDQPATAAANPETNNTSAGDTPVINSQPVCQEYESENAVTETQTQTPANLKRCTLRHGGLDRVFYLYVPGAYPSSIGSLPLLFSLHGYTSNALTHLSYAGFGSLASSESFIVVYPQGSILQSTGSTHWNVGGWTDSSTTNDVNFIETMIDYLTAEFRIDTDRIYSTGMSNGGFMSYRLACDLGDKIAAVASVTGSMTPETFRSCNPGRPKPVMQIHGSLDNTVPYEGNSGMKPIQDVMEYWSVTNRCDTSPDIDPIPDLTADGFAGIKTQYKNCQNEVAVTLYLLDRMGHEWPLSGAHDIDAPSTIWQFLSKYNRYGLIQ